LLASTDCPGLATLLVSAVIGFLTGDRVVFAGLPESFRDAAGRFFLTASEEFGLELMVVVDVFATLVVDSVFAALDCGLVSELAPSGDTSRLGMSARTDDALSRLLRLLDSAGSFCIC
jgi:hypothetical protein